MLRATFCMILLALLSPNALISQTQQSQADSIQSKNKDIIVGVHSEPSYPGGVKAWQKHIRKKIALLAPPCQEGKVFVSFTVLASGKLDSIYVYRSLCELADQNAIDILKTSGNWTPEYVDGKPIDSRMGIYIVYRYKRR